MSKRYTIHAEHETETCQSFTRSTDLILEAVAMVEAHREDDDGSFRFWIQDSNTGRKVTRGDVRKASETRARNLETAELLREFSGRMW